MTDPHAICRKWVSRLRAEFRPEKSSKDYGDRLDGDWAREYDEDMATLFRVAESPSECAMMALADEGLD